MNHPGGKTFSNLLYGPNNDLGVKAFSMQLYGPINNLAGKAFSIYLIHIQTRPMNYWEMKRLVY